MDIISPKVVRKGYGRDQRLESFLLAAVLPFPLLSSLTPAVGTRQAGKKSEKDKGVI